MNDRTTRALIGFIAGSIGLAALQTIVNEEAAELGLPHAAAGAIVGLIAAISE